MIGASDSLPYNAWQDFTFVCPTEIIAFSDRVEEFNDLNCDLIAASTDTEEVRMSLLTQPALLVCVYCTVRSLYLPVIGTGAPGMDQDTSQQGRPWPHEDSHYGRHKEGTFLSLHHFYNY